MQELVHLLEFLSKLNKFLHSEVNLLLQHLSLSANNEGEDEMIPGMCTNLLAFTFRLKKTRENLS